MLHYINHIIFCNLVTYTDILTKGGEGTKGTSILISRNTLAMSMSYPKRKDKQQYTKHYIEHLRETFNS